MASSVKSASLSRGGLPPQQKPVDFIGQIPFGSRCLPTSDRSVVDRTCGRWLGTTPSVMNIPPEAKCSVFLVEMISQALHLVVEGLLAHMDLLAR